MGAKIQTQALEEGPAVQIQPRAAQAGLFGGHFLEREHMGSIAGAKGISRQ